MRIFSFTRKKKKPPTTQTLFVSETLSVEFARRTGTKHLRLAVRRDGRVRVSGPWNITEGKAQAFVLQHQTWIERARTKMSALSHKVLPKITTANFAAKQAEALQIILTILEQIAPLYGFTYKAIRIKQQKTRWGSCSNQGNLNFNVQIIHLPSHLAEYLVIHEYCHLKELNHSTRFWALVRQACPTYVRARRELRTQYRLS